MQYYCYIDNENVVCKLENKVVARFEVETFFVRVISPLEFKRFERNPDKRLFNIRKLELNTYKL